MDARHIADDHLRAQRAVGDNVGDAVVAVFLADVIDDLAAAAHAKIDIEVGRRNAFGIQESLEEQFETQRVEIGDAEEVGDDTTRAGAAARADGDVLFPGPIDEIPNDEEVIDEAGLADDAELVVDALGEGLGEGLVGECLRGGGVKAVALGEAEETEFPKIAGAIGAGGDFWGEGIFRIPLAALGERDGEIAHLRDQLGVRHGLGHLAEELRHLVAGLQVEFLTGEPHTFLVIDLRAGLNAEHRIVGAGVMLADVVNIVGGDDLQVELFAQLQEPGNDFKLLGDAMVLDFDEVVFAAEDLDEASAGLARLLVAVVKEVLGDEGCEAAGEADQAVGVFRECFKVGAGFVIKPLEVCVGDQLEQILIAREVFREEAEVKHALAVLVGAAVFLETGGLDEVEFTADERLDALGLGLVVKLYRAVEIAVVGESERLHAQLRGAVHEPVYPARTVEQTVVGVDVEVDEILVGGRHGGTLGNGNGVAAQEGKKAIDARRVGWPSDRLFLSPPRPPTCPSKSKSAKMSLSIVRCAA